MENTEHYSTTLPLPFSSARRGYPAHDPLLAHYSALISQNQPDTIDEERNVNTDLPTIETSMHDHASIDIDIEDPNLDAEIEEDGTSNSPALIGSNNHESPRRSAYLLGMYLAFLGLVLMKLIREDHTSSPVTNPFIIFSIVVYAMAFMDLCILAWMHERLENSSLSYENVGLRLYMILKDAYYILCILAFFSLLPMLLTPHPHPHPHH